MTAKLQRRQVLGTGLAGLAAMTMGNVQAVPIPKWDREVDILVVGTGFAGLCAAIEAKSAGRSPELIEMMSYTGGNFRIIGGGIAAPGNPMQKEKGIEDSPELLLAGMLKASNQLDFPDLAKTVAYGALDAYNWLVDEIGARFVRIIYHGGHSVICSCGAELLDAHVTNFMPKFEEKAVALNIPILKRTKLVRLFTDDEGAVIGAELRRDYTFGKPDSGTPEFVRTGGIVLGSGGFAADPAMRKLADPRLDESVETTNLVGGTGEAIAAAQMIGAGVIPNGLDSVPPHGELRRRRLLRRRALYGILRGFRALRGSGDREAFRKRNGQPQGACRRHLGLEESGALRRH